MELSQGHRLTEKLKMVTIGILWKSTLAKVTMATLLFCTFLLYCLYNYTENHVFTWNPNENEIMRNQPTIYFVETSGKKTLDAREVCSIESAAQHHPGTNITLLSIAKFDADDFYIRALHTMPNVQLNLLNLNTLFADTPLETWHHEGVVEESNFPVEHLSDAVRLALLYKNGGAYLDTDVICLRALPFHNAVGLQERGEVNGAVMLFDANHSFLYRCMQDYVRNFSRTVWANQGPDLITRILKSTCHVEFLGDVIRDPASCDGVTILPENIFYPIPWPEWHKLFETARNSDVDIESAYTIHLWAKLSRSTSSVLGSGTLLDNVCKHNCPKTYELMQRLQ